MRCGVQRLLTPVVCRCCLNSSMVVFEMLISRNMPSSFEVNWQPHSVWAGEGTRLVNKALRQILSLCHKGSCTPIGQSSINIWAIQFSSRGCKLFILNLFILAAEVMPAHLKLWDHVLLRVIRDTLVGEQPPCKVLLIVPLEHVLLLHEAEQHHGLVQYGLHLLLGQLDKKGTMMHLGWSQWSVLFIQCG